MQATKSLYGPSLPTYTKEIDDQSKAMFLVNKYDPDVVMPLKSVMQ